MSETTEVSATPIGDEVRRAARLMRSRGSEVAGGPWFLDHEEAERQEENADDPMFIQEYADDTEWRVGCPGSEVGGGHFDGFYVIDNLRLPLARWVAMLGPQLANPLASLLDGVAPEIDSDELDELPADVIHARYGNAIDLARAIAADAES